MILACRRNNAWLTEPPPAQLLTAEGPQVFEFEGSGGAQGHLGAAQQAALADMEFSISVAYVKGAFHRARLPPPEEAALRVTRRQGGRRWVARCRVGGPAGAARRS
eukprot:9096721-Pyramimonas_sp.AAC.1